MSCFLLAVIRNCGVAIAISIFFAAAHVPSHPPRPGAVEKLAAAETRNLAATLPSPGCDPVRACPVDAVPSKSAP